MNNAIKKLKAGKHALLSFENIENSQRENMLMKIFSACFYRPYTL
jgi:hypothetical protein